MKNKTSRRISASSAYIGAGNKTSAFSRKARKAFENVPDVYKNTLRKGGAINSDKELPKAERQSLAKRLKGERRVRNFKITVAFLAVVALLLVAVLVFLQFYRS